MSCNCVEVCSKEAPAARSKSHWVSDNPHISVTVDYCPNCLKQVLWLFHNGKTYLFASGVEIPEPRLFKRDDNVTLSLHGGVQMPAVIYEDSGPNLDMVLVSFPAFKDRIPVNLFGIHKKWVTLKE